MRHSPLSTQRFKDVSWNFLLNTLSKNTKLYLNGFFKIILKESYVRESPTVRLAHRSDFLERYLPILRICLVVPNVNLQKHLNFTLSKSASKSASNSAVAESFFFSIIFQYQIWSDNRYLPIEEVNYFYT